MTLHQPLCFGGDIFDCEHLRPKIISCEHKDTPEARDLRIVVKYSNHCYSEEFVDGMHDEQLVLWDHQRKRAFCRERYTHSLFLPGLMDELPSKRVYQTAQARNYGHFVCLPQIEGREYQIYFSMRRQATNDSDLMLYVESAYASDKEPSLRKRPNNIRFAVLALKTLRGQPIRFAAR